MIDFMVNIKNKKDMTKCNIKTLMATSVLCIFFNGVLIYGTDNSDDEKNDNKNKPILTIEEQQNNNNKQQNEYEDSVIKEIMENDEVDEDKIITMRKKKIKDNIFLNFEGDISLLFCCNLCNNKPEKVEEYFQKHILELKNIDKHEPNTTIKYEPILNDEDDEDKQ